MVESGKKMFRSFAYQVIVVEPKATFGKKGEAWQGSLIKLIFGVHINSGFDHHTRDHISNEFAEILENSEFRLAHAAADVLCVVDMVLVILKCSRSPSCW